MKKYVRNKLCNSTVTIFLIIFCSSNIQARNIHLSFDSLFPVTWYQKSLQSCLFVWHILSDAFENDNEQLSFDIILSRLTFAQFCINRMQQENVIYLPEDIDYLKMILKKIKELIEVLVVDDSNQDAIECIYEVAVSIEKSI